MIVAPFLEAFHGNPTSNFNHICFESFLVYFVNYSILLIVVIILSIFLPTAGFTHGCRGFLLSILCAIAGVADQPMQELFRAESVRDATSGVVTGVGKGLIGVVTKPLGGAMELVSQTGQGILQGTGLGETPRRLYEPERRGAVIGSNSHLKYFWYVL